MPQPQLSRSFPGELVCFELRHGSFLAKSHPVVWLRETFTDSNIIFFSSCSLYAAFERNQGKAGGFGNQENRPDEASTPIRGGSRQGGGAGHTPMSFFREQS